MSERADLIAAKERLTKSAAISTMATSGRSRSYDGHQMQMVRLEDLRLLLAENSLSEQAYRSVRPASGEVEALVAEARALSLELRGLSTHDAERTLKISARVQLVLERLATALDRLNREGR